MRKFFTELPPPERAGLALIVAAGLGLRLWHISWGLPDLFEEAYPLHIATRFWDWNGAGADLNPHFFNYPALSFYLHYAVQSVHYGAGRLLGIYPDLQAFGNDLPASVIAARLFTSLLDAGSIFVAWLLARRIAGRTAGFIAAACVAFSPLAVRQAHLINVDTPLAFFALVALLFCAKIVDGPTRRSYILGGIAIGLAAGTKYTGAWLVASLLVAHFLRTNTSEEMHPLVNPALGIVAAAAVFLLTNPYILLASPEFIRDLQYEQFHMSYGHLGLDTSQSTPAYYILNVLPGALGPLLLAGLAAGI